MFFSARLALTSDPIMQGNPCSVAFPMQLLGGWVDLRGRAPCGNKAPGFLFRPEMTCKTWPQERDGPL